MVPYRETFSIHARVSSSRIRPSLLRLSGPVRPATFGPERGPLAHGRTPTARTCPPYDLAAPRPRGRLGASGAKPRRYGRPGLKSLVLSRGRPGETWRFEHEDRVAAVGRG